MKNSTPVCSPIDFTLMILLLASTGMAQERSKEGKIGGTYWSAQRPNYPPLPANPFPDLPVDEIAPGTYLYDDRDVDYVQLEAEASAASKASESEAASLQSSESGGGSPPMMMQGGGLCLLTPQFDGGNVVLKIAGAEEGARYDVFVCTSLSPPLQWSFVTRGAEGQTNLPFAAPAGAVALFQLGTMQDTDGDTLTDAYEALVSHTDPNVADTVETAGANAALVAVLTPEQPLLYLHTYKLNLQNTLLNNPNLCDFPNSFPTETVTEWSWTNFAGGTYRGTSRVHYCDPATQTPRTTVGVTEGTWESNDRSCVRGQVDDGPWSDLLCSPADGPIPPPRNERWVKVSLSRQVDIDNFSFGQSEIKEAKVRLETRGPAFSLRQRFWRIHATARDYGDNSTPGGSEVAPQLIQVMDKNLNSAGYAYFLLQDGTTNDVTPSLPPQFTNYSFTVNTDVADLRIFFNGQDFTDAGPVAWIGQRIPLVCRLVPEIPEIATITNYQWSIQGNIISNWIATSTSGKAYFDNVFTNADITYYYWKPGTSLEARCLVKVEGIEMVAKTTFNVLAPGGGMTAQILNVVKVDNNWTSFPNVALHFGDQNGLPGIRFTRSVQGDCAWLQIATILRRKRSSIDGTWARVSGTGLDGDFPYPVAGLAVQTSDSPGSPVFGETGETTAGDQFKMFLMFRPNGLAGIGAIYVPIARIGWSWGGHAILQNDQWSLVPNSSSATVDPAAIDPPAYPEWELQIDPIFLDNWQDE